VGLVWSGYMERIWNGAGERVRPSVFRGRFHVFQTCVVSHGFKTHDISFVSTELHPRLFTPCHCVLLCLIKPMLGNRYIPGVSARASQGSMYPRLRIANAPPHHDFP